MSRTTAGCAAQASLGLAALLSFGVTTPAGAQATGTVAGTVRFQGDGTPLGGVAVVVHGTGIVAVTAPDGSYALTGVPIGRRTVSFRWPGYQLHTASVTVQARPVSQLDVTLVAQPVSLDGVVITPSRTPEPVVTAPAAVSLVDLAQGRMPQVTGQVPQALSNLPGVDLAQSGMTDFNLNVRGFNSSLNRRVLVLQDGRDLSVPFLGAPEWAAVQAFEDAGRMELVRGPGSALYGANAFSGVLAITTPSAREVTGTRLAVAGGELETLRGDLRHAAVFARGRAGYKVTAGFSRSDTWSRSRTSLDGLDLRREYEGATDGTVAVNGVERRPLTGQAVDPAIGAAQGDRAPLTTAYGSGRLDWYVANGSMLSVEGGATQVENEVFITGIGRVQVTKALRPWGRVAWTHPRATLTAWYSGRSSLEPQYSLLSGAPLDDHSRALNAEGQYRRDLGGDRAHLAFGASVRNTAIRTNATFLAAEHDGRSDWSYAGYGQLAYDVTPQLRAVAAVRFDDADLFAAQVSPKAALVFSPTAHHSLRATFNRAFQTPTYAELFLRAPAGTPVTAPGSLERNVEQLFAAVKSTVGTVPAIAALALPNDLPWDFDSLTPSLALGNADLRVERVTSWELGYRGRVSSRVSLTVDAYLNELRDFVTDLLSAVNPAYPRYLLTDGGTNVATTLTELDAIFAALRAAGQITAAQEATHRGTIAALLDSYNGFTAAAGARLATLPGGARAVVTSYTNAGRVIERGIEIGAGTQVTDQLMFSGSYTLFGFAIKQSQAGDSLKPNTPAHKGSVALSYRDPTGLDLSLVARFVAGYDWAAGVFVGRIPPSETLDASLGYVLSRRFRLSAVATNVFDQRHYHTYGGSVIGRRILGGVTATF